MLTPPPHDFVFSRRTVNEFPANECLKVEPLILTRSVVVFVVSADQDYGLIFHLNHESNQRYFLESLISAYERSISLPIPIRAMKWRLVQACILHGLLYNRPS